MAELDRTVLDQRSKVLEEAAAEVVDDPDTGAALYERFDQMGADERRSARDENVVLRPGSACPGASGAGPELGGVSIVVGVSALGGLLTPPSRRVLAVLSSTPGPAERLLRQARI